MIKRKKISLKKQKKSGRAASRFFIILSIFFALLIISTAYVLSFIQNLPSPEQFATRQISQTTKIYDRTGKVLLYEIHGDEKRTVVPFSEIPDYVKRATLAAEDAAFYNEPAFNWRGIVRAMIANIKSGSFSQGGSTITQQLVKKSLLSSDKTITRKIKELVLAIELESKYSKDEILYYYLNQIPYGSNAYGVEAASQTYFNKSVRDIDVAEAAILASLIKAPSYYSPWGNNVKELISRQKYVLERMRSLGFISEDQYNNAVKEKLEFAPQSLGLIKAPHFALMVKDYLIGRYGEYTALQGGLKVVTTLDMNLQNIAEKVVEDGVKRNKELYGGTNGALVAEDPRTGQILAFVGSRNYFNDEIDGKFNVPIQGLRQPGSALKPFVYLTAFEKGYSPKTVLFDAKTEFDTRNDPQKSYQPENFEGTFVGPVKMETALAQSMNVPAVKTLYLVGINSALKTFNTFGISTLKDPSRYGLSLTLGGGEVTMMDLIKAYSVLSQEGVLHQQKIVLRVEDGLGNVLEEYNDDSKRVVDEQNTRIINKILSSADLRSGLFQSSLSMTTFPGYDVALKTGTTQDYRDAWAFGYTPSLVVGVWAGNNNNTPMKQRGSSLLAAVPIWNAFLKEALPLVPQEFFKDPEPLELSNKPMIGGYPYFSPVINGKSYPQIHSILYYVNKNDPLGPVPENPSADPEFYNWETAVLEWGRKNIPNFYEYNQPLPKNVPYTSSSSNP